MLVNRQEKILNEQKQEYNSDISMRIKRLFVCISLISLLLSLSWANAEVIHCKGGQVIKGKISHRSGNSVWMESENGYSGVPLARIERIENDDGSISDYDLVGLSRGATDFLREGNYAEAVKLYSRLLASLPNKENVDIRSIYYIRGILYHQLGRVSDAAKDYEFLLQRNEADARIYNNLGIIYADGKAYPEAEDLLLRALNEDPQMTEARNNLARLYLGQDDFRKAAQQYKGIIEREPENTEALYNLGVIYMKEENYPSAERLWRSLLALEPDNQGAQEALEIIRSRSGEGN